MKGEVIKYVNEEIGRVKSKRRDGIPISRSGEFKACRFRWGRKSVKIMKKMKIHRRRTRKASTYGILNCNNGKVITF